LGVDGKGRLDEKSNQRIGKGKGEGNTHEEGKKVSGKVLKGVTLEVERKGRKPQERGSS